MKTIILAAFAVVLVALFANRFDGSARALTRANAQASPATVQTAGSVADRAVFDNAPVTIYLAERTIAAQAPRTATTARKVATPHQETDAEHVQRLMTATPEMVSCAGCTPRKPFETYTGKVSRLSPELY